jgi:hypothetical protein
MLMQRTSSSMAPWQLDTAPLLPVPVPPRPVVLRPQDVLRARVPLGRSAPSVGGSVLSMNPLSLEGSTMVPTTFTRIRSMFRPRRINSHPDAVPEASLHLSRRTDDRRQQPSSPETCSATIGQTSRWRCAWTTGSAWSVLPSSPLAGSKQIACPLARSSSVPRRALQRIGRDGRPDVSPTCWSEQLLPDLNTALAAVVGIVSSARLIRTAVRLSDCPR